MMTLEQMRPRRDQRMMIVGATGSGKTTLAARLLPSSGALLVIDSKCTFGGVGGREDLWRVSTPSQLRRLPKKATRIQYRPDVAFQNIDAYDEVFEWAFRRQKVFVYVDETFLVMKGTYSPDYLRACITSGRELGIGMVFATQRPSGIDQRILTESEHFAMFRLRKKLDRERMADCMGEEVERNPKGFAFWHLTPTMEHPKLRVLELTNGG